MTFNSPDAVWVWMQPHGQLRPVVCGKFTLELTGTEMNVGKFIYGASYLSRPDAAPIDPELLPLKAEEFSTRLLGGIFSVMSDAGPDSWGRRLIEHEIGVQSELGYLLQNKGDQVGSLSFSSEMLAPPVMPHELGLVMLKDLYDASAALEEGRPISASMERFLRHGTSAGGARPKATIIDSGKVWIAKLPSKKDREDLPSNPRLEAATLDLACLCGITVPEHRLERIGNVDALLVERFDRKLVEQEGLLQYEKFHYVSARTIFYSKPAVQQWSYTGSYPRFSRELSKWSASAENDRVELFKRLVFNCLVSNTDDHDLNHGMVNHGRGFVLSPAFDIVPQVSATIRRLQSISVGEDGAAATSDNVLSDCEAFGLTQTSAKTLISSISECISANWDSCLKHRGIAAAEREKVASCFVPPGFFDPPPHNTRRRTRTRLS